MTKDEFIQLLAGSSFDGYLKACHHFSDYVQNGGELDQEIIERCLFINLLPRWADHADLKEKFDQITTELPRHGDLLNDQAMGTHLRGVSIFINGLINRQFDVSGFFYCSNGYMCSHTACTAISDHYLAAGKSEEATYFLQLSQWFLDLYTGTTEVFRAIMGITAWNEEMVVGLTNFLDASLESYGVFEWILSGLYKVVHDPLIKGKVFDHYHDKFKKALAILVKQQKKEAAADLKEKIKRLKIYAKGKTP